MNKGEKRGRIIFNTLEKKMYSISDIYIKQNIGYRNDQLVEYLNNSENYCVFLDKSKSLFSDDLVAHYWTLHTDGIWLWSADLKYYTDIHGLKWPSSCRHRLAGKRKRYSKSSHDLVKWDVAIFLVL